MVARNRDVHTAVYIYCSSVLFVGVFRTGGKHIIADGYILCRAHRDAIVIACIDELIAYDLHVLAGESLSCDLDTV